MIRTKYQTKSARVREMREDLSIIMGVQPIRRAAGRPRAGPTHFSSNKMFQQSNGTTRASGEYRAGNQRGSAVIRRSGVHAVVQPSLSSQVLPSGTPGRAFISSANKENEGMMLPPPLVTPVACRNARMGGKAMRSTNWPNCSSQVIVRDPSSTVTTSSGGGIPGFSPNLDVFRRPMPYMMKSVQPPPETPATPLKVANGLLENNNQYVLQSPWVSRSRGTNSQPVINTPYSSVTHITKTLSIKQIIDSLCGEGPEIPELSALTKKQFPSKPPVASSPSLTPALETPLFEPGQFCLF